MGYQHYLSELSLTCPPLLFQSAPSPSKLNVNLEAEPTLCQLKLVTRLMEFADPTPRIQSLLMKTSLSPSWLGYCRPHKAEEHILRHTLFFLYLVQQKVNTQVIL